MKDYIKQEKNKRLKGYLLSIIFAKIKGAIHIFVFNFIN